MIEFILPQTPGEWLCWLVALAMVLTGLAMMLVPRRIMGHLGFALDLGRPNGLSELRGPIGGFYVGIGLVAMVFHPQPLIYMAIGGAFAVTVLGRLISMVFDGAYGGSVLFWTLVEAFAAGVTLAYVFGFIA